MMTIRFGSPHITKIWLEDPCSEEQVIRVDFDNNRHCRVVINRPGNQENIAQAFMRLAYLIQFDPHLNEEQVCIDTNKIKER